jgi:DNA-binding CsgD family transcriptional regulator
MTRQARLGGDFSRWDARRLPDGELGEPGGGLRALGSLEISPRRQAQAAPTDALATPVGRALRAVVPAPGPSVRDAPKGASHSSEFARAHREGAANDVPRVDRRSSASEGWTVVDTYERDGKRYVIAQRSEVRLRAPRTLSKRERQALGIAVLGDTNKVIAYEMGISASTVGVLLYRAARKLGSRTRAELLARFRELVAVPGQEQPSH